VADARDRDRHPPSAELLVQRDQFELVAGCRFRGGSVGV
jgi:hypothetical protein